MSLVQSVTAESLGASASISATLNGVVPNNDLRLHVTWGTDTLTDFDTVTDGVNNAKWTIDKKVASGGHSQSDGMAYAVGVTGGSLTVSCNFLNTPTFKALILEEFTPSGGFRASAMQLQAAPGSGVDAITSGATAAVSGDEIVGGTSDISPSTDTFTIGTGYSEGATINDSGNVEMHSEWKSGSGSDAGTFKGAAGTGNYITGAMAFKPPVSGGVGVIANLGSAFHPGRSPGLGGISSARFQPSNWWPYSPPAILVFDPAFMIAMEKHGNDPLVLPPQVVASGMTPPEEMPT